VMCKVCFIVIPYALFNTLYYAVRVKVYGVIQGCCKVHLCSVCRQAGHNRRICPNQPVEHGRAQRARDRLVVEGKY
jgi:hypothetical protein